MPRKKNLKRRVRERMAAGLENVLAQRPILPIAAAVSRASDHLVDPDLPYVVAVAVAASANTDAGVIEAWSGSGGPRLHVSGILVVEKSASGMPVGRLYHHPEPRRPLTASPLLRLPQGIWRSGRYVHGDGESLASLLGERWKRNGPKKGR